MRRMRAKLCVGLSAEASTDQGRCCCLVHEVGTSRAWSSARANREDFRLTFVFPEGLRAWKACEHSHSRPWAPVYHLC